MLKNIFLKTLFEKRWMILWWTLSSLIMSIFIVAFFPTLRDTIGASMNQIPESMRSLMGDASDYQQLNGYVAIQVFGQMVFLPIVLGIILCTGLIGGEENEGTLQTLLTYPVSRSKVYLHKLAASAAIIGIVTMGFFVGSWLGSFFINVHIDAWRLLQATFMTWLVSYAVSLLGFALTGVMGRRALSGSIAGAFIFATYIITSLVTSVKSLRGIEHLSPFHYFNQPSPLKAAFDFGDMCVLLVVSVVLIVWGYVFFIRRDVNQH